MQARTRDGKSVTQYTEPNMLPITIPNQPGRVNRATNRTCMHAHMLGLLNLAPVLRCAAWPGLAPATNHWLQARLPAHEGADHAAIECGRSKLSQ